MKKSYPDYYKEFRCIADRCEATCCAGWQIVVDEESLKKYRKVTGEFRERIRDGVDFKEGVFRQNPGKRCAFLNETNLCDMYTALGEDAFCDTCRRYPRHIEEFENVREYTLSVSCPEAARILLSQKEPVEFYTVCEESEEEVFEEFNPVLYDALVEARALMIGMIQNRQYSLKERAKALWDFAEAFQESMDEGSLLLNGLPEISPKDPETSYEEAKALFGLLHHLECLAEDWDDYLKEIEERLYGAGEEMYTQYKKSFRAWTSEHLPEWEIMLEQLLLYFVYTYFCGSIYDEYVASKVKMSVCSVFYIEEMVMARWLKNGSKLELDEIVRVVYRYSRELEHSDENLCTMDRIMEEI